jgi:hypothetical protein
MCDRTILVALAVLAASLALAGCVTPADDATTQSTPDTPDEPADDSWGKPLPDEIQGLETVTTAEAVENGRGVVAHGDHVYASGGQGFHVVDVSTPDDPKVVGELPELGSRDVDLIHYQGNRTVAVLATQSNGMKFVDVTTPEDPELLASVLEGVSVHNLAVVPGTSTVYNSRSLSVGPDQGVDVVDASDPANPEVVRFADNVLTCHDVDFRVSDDRAYCAGVTATEIWDISDPEQPEVVSTIANPAISIHHWATPAQDGDLLVIGDEFAGAAAYGCGARAETPGPGGDASDPVGSVWFYDISNEDAPQPLSWLSVDAPTDNWDNDPGTACTAHFGELVPDRDKLVVGWYIAGTYIVDFSDPTAPQVVDRWRDQSDVWDARVHNGYVFTGDSNRGVDILSFAGGS